MNILEVVRKTNPMNEFVRLLDTIKNNHRIDPERAVRNWTPDLRLNALTEVVMEIINRVDSWGDTDEQVEESAEAVTVEDFRKLAEKIEDLNKMMAYAIAEVEALKNAPCGCKDKTDSTEGTEEEPKPKNGRGRKTAQS